MQGDIRHWADAAPDPARLWAQHAKPRGREALRDLIIVVGIPRKRRQQNDGRALALRNNFDLHVAITHKIGAAFGGLC